MQITLNQTEIETALRRYVNDQVNIREGHEIIIDLKAGRGENGFSATIDIVPADGLPKASEPASAATSTKPLGIQDKVRSKPQPATPTVSEESVPETTQEAADEAVTQAATDASPEPETAAMNQDDGETSETDEEAPPTEKPKSLFAKLQKPRN